MAVDLGRLITNSTPSNSLLLVVTLCFSELPQSFKERFDLDAESEVRKNTVY